VVNFAYGGVFIEHHSIELTNIRHVAHQGKNTGHLAAGHERYSVEENGHVVIAVHLFERGDAELQRALDRPSPEAHVSETAPFDGGVDAQTVQRVDRVGSSELDPPNSSIKMTRHRRAAARGRRPRLRGRERSRRTPCRTSGERPTSTTVRTATPNRVAGPASAPRPR